MFSASGNGIVAAVQVAAARRLVVVVLADPITVACMVVMSDNVYDTFLSRGRGESRVGDEWALTWMSATAITIDTVFSKQGFAAVKGSGVVMWSREEEEARKEAIRELGSRWRHLQLLLASTAACLASRGMCSGNT